MNSSSREPSPQPVAATSVRPAASLATEKPEPNPEWEAKADAAHAAIVAEVGESNPFDTLVMLETWKAHAEPADSDGRISFSRALLDSAQSALRVALEMARTEYLKTKWRDINTAPKDGSPFLVYLPQAAWEPSLKPTITVMYWASWENFASHYAERIGETEGDAGDWGPTHWMPLPTAPEDTAAADASERSEESRPLGASNASTGKNP